MFSRPSTNSRGFTLIELMIVVSILGVMAALAIPRFMQATTKSKQTEAKGILKQIYTMERAWRQDHSSYTADLAAIGVVIPTTTDRRYNYTVTATATAFTAVALCAAPGLDDDPSADEWRIDHTGQLWCSINDVNN